MNSSTVYERLVSLLQTVGLAGAHGDILRAEVKAYAAAVSFVQHASEQVLSEAFADTMSQKGILMYCDLLKIESGETQEETIEKIISRLSEGFYIMETHEFRELEENATGYNVDYTNNIKTITISPVNKETLSSVSDLVNHYYPVIYSPPITGSGLCFDSLDSLDIRWFEAEEYNLPFYIWDKLG